MSLTCRLVCGMGGALSIALLAAGSTLVAAAALEKHVDTLSLAVWLWRAAPLVWGVTVLGGSTGFMLMSRQAKRGALSPVTRRYTRIALAAAPLMGVAILGWAALGAMVIGATGPGPTGEFSIMAWAALAGILGAPLGFLALSPR